MKILHVVIWITGPFISIRIIFIMNSKVHKILFAIDNIISRLAFALVLSVLISVLLAHVITSLNSSSDYTTRNSVAFILSAH